MTEGADPAHRTESALPLGLPSHPMPLVAVSRDSTGYCYKLLQMREFPVTGIRYPFFVRPRRIGDSIGEEYTRSHFISFLNGVTSWWGGRLARVCRWNPEPAGEPPAPPRPYEMASNDLLHRKTLPQHYALLSCNPAVS